MTVRSSSKKKKNPSNPRSATKKKTPTSAKSSSKKRRSTANKISGKVAKKSANSKKINNSENVSKSSSISGIQEAHAVEKINNSEDKAQGEGYTLDPPKRDPNAIFITFGFSLFLIFSMATISSLGFLFEVFANSGENVMGGQVKNETSQEDLVESDSLEDIPEYFIKKGFSKGEINESADDSFYLSWPVKSGRGIVTQCFSEEHPGIDIADYRSPKILASADGDVIFAGCFENDCPEGSEIKNSEGLAHAVMIKHPNGMITVYGHLKSILVREGQQVSRGDVLGIMGNTGTVESISEGGEGIHLHYALITDTNWSYLNPADYMVKKICGEGKPDPEAYWGQDSPADSEGGSDPQPTDQGMNDQVEEPVDDPGSNIDEGESEVQQEDPGGDNAQEQSDSSQILE